MKKALLALVAVCLGLMAQAQIEPSPTSLSFTAPVGSCSGAQVVSVNVNVIYSGSPALTVIAPPGYRISPDDTSWASTIQIPLISGVNLGVQIYVEFCPTMAQPYPAGLVLSTQTMPAYYLPLCGNGDCPQTISASSGTFSLFVNELCPGPGITFVNNTYSASQFVVTQYGDETHDTATMLPGIGSSAAYAFNTHNYQLPGAYTLKSILYSGGVAADSATYSFQYKLCNTIPVYYFADVDGDCTYTAGTDYYNSRPVSTEVDSNGVAVDTVSATSGFYYVAYGIPGDVYTFKALNLPSWYQLSCASAVVSDTIKSGLYNDQANYIGLKCAASSEYDYAVSVSPVGTGHHFQEFNVLTSRTRCASAPSKVTVHYSPHYKFYEAWPMPDSVYGNTLVWNLDTVTTTDITSSIRVAIHITDPSLYLTPGDTVQTDVRITPTTGDADTSNNYCVRTDTVKGSYDPNSMVVVPNTCIAPNVATNLNFFVNFENTGNDTAHNIYVLDTLSDLLDPNSFQILGATAVMNVMKFKGGGHNILKFDFPSINLLDSSHHGLCTGTVQYGINTLPTVASGATITNEAGIYFDDNAVVMTNQSLNNIGCPSLVKVVERAGSIALHPNPSAGIVTLAVSNADYTHYDVATVMGQTVLAGGVAGAQTQIDISELPVGVYYVTVSGSGMRVVAKLVKL